MKLPKIKVKVKNKQEKRVKPQKLKKRKKVNKKNLILIFLISMGILFASAILAFALYIIVTSPDFVPTKLYNKEATVIYAKDGTTEIARYGKKNVKLITYNELPQVLVDALVATEDSRFFQHNGFDAARFIKASMGQLAGQNAGGASTLSMQVIKNTFTSSEARGIEGIIRKFTDIYMAVFKLEAVYTKEEVIEFYLNSQWLGGGSTYYGSITGVEQGSQYFFGKSVSDLTLAEASLLVGMFNNPLLLNPYTNPKDATARRSVVLSLMVRHGYITEEEREFAESIPVKSLLADRSKDTNDDYQAFIDFVLRQVKQETNDNPYDTPMAIYTTLDLSIQDTLNKLEKGEIWKFADNKVQFGMAITSVEDGSILGLSGGRNYRPTGTHRGVGLDNYGIEGINRQPGSTAKPIFDYGPYLEYLHGSTGTIFLDEPWTYTNGMSVLNADRGYRGPITMRSALVASRNVPAIQAFQQVAKEVGMDKIADFVHGLGVNYGKTLVESAGLGGFDGTDPLTMSAAYATFGRGGTYIKPYAFTKVVYLETGAEYNHPIERSRAMSEQTAYMLTDMLVTGGASGVGGNFSISGTQMAAKGGTSTIDATNAAALGIPRSATPNHWNITYTPDYSIALWYGYDNLKQGYLTSSTGMYARKGIMKAVATRVYKKNSRFTVPTGVTSVTIEKETYPTELASKDYTPSAFKLTELYQSGYEPSEVSNRFTKLDAPTNGKSAFDGKTITISWDPISTPEAIDTNKIEEMYNSDPYWQFYERYKAKYYEKRINYNKSSIGDVGYQVYLQDSSGNLNSLGFTTNPSYTYQASASLTDYTFVIKSAYSIYKTNISDGLTIKAQAKIDDNIGDIGGPEIPDNPDDSNNNPPDNGALE